MKGSYRLGQAFGIGIFVHWSFALLLIYVLASTLVTGAGLVVAFNSVVFVLAVFACVVLHELGHSLAARRYGIGTHDITLLPIGGLARLKAIPEDPKQEMVIAVAGPAVNVVIAAVLGLIAFLMGPPSAGALLTLSSDVALLHALIVANIILVVFNMIPAFPMDGGRVLRALLAMKKGHLPATEIAAKLGKVFAVLMFLAAFKLTPFLFVTAVFIYIAGQAELNAVRQRHLAAQDPMQEMMRRAMAAFSLEAGQPMPGAPVRDEPKPVRGRVIDPN